MQEVSIMKKLEREFQQKDTFLRRWAAVLLLVLFFFTSWGGQFATQLEVAKQQAQDHNQEFKMDDYWPEFWSSTFENWQSEWLQLTVQALLIAAFADVLFRKGNQDHYKTQAMIEELREEVKQLKGKK